MLTNTLEIAPVTSLTDKFAKNAEEKNFQAPSPDKFFVSEITSYSLEELIEKNSTDLEELGLSEDKLIEMLESDVLSMEIKEKISDIEKGIDIATDYWDLLNKNLEKRLAKSNETNAILYADARIRSLGVHKLLEAMKDNSTEDVYDRVRKVLITANDLFVLAEADYVGFSLNDSAKCACQGEATTMAIAESDVFEESLKLLHNSSSDVFISSAIESCIIGVKAEYITAKMISETEVSGAFFFVKSNPAVDQYEGIDFAIYSMSNGKSVDKLLFDVECADSAFSEGSCILIPSGKNILARVGPDTGDYLITKFDITPNFLNSITRKKVPGISIRLPRSLANSEVLTDFYKMDENQQLDYNDAKDLLHSQIREILEGSNQ